MNEEKREDEIKTFVNAEDVLDKLRENNMSTVDSVCELIDNSLDANAKNIWIDFGLRSGKDTMWMIVQDDGNGIRKNELMRALRLGGTMNPNYSKKIGRFGMGLSNACASQSPRSVFASKVKGDKATWANEIDFDYLQTHKAEFPPTYELNDPFLTKRILFKDSGTVVYWTVCDNLDKAKPETLQAHLIDTISRVYRYFINAGMKIWINGNEISLFDPLCRLENHRFRDEYMGKIYGDPVIIPIKYDDEDGKEKISNITVELVLLDYKRVNKQQNPELHKKLEIGMRRQGLYLIRNNREIGNPEWFGTATQRYDWLNYVRGEIRFDSILDHKFGIGHNKSRAYPKDVVLEGLRARLKPMISNALSEHKRAMDELEELQKSGGSELAQRIHQSAKEIVIPDPKITQIPKIGSKQPKTAEKFKEEIIKKIDNAPTISLQLKEKKKQVLQALLEGKYDGGLILLPDGPSAPIFRTDVVNGKKIIILNTDHKFYEYVYEPATNSEYRHTLIDLIFYVLADVKEEVDGDYYLLFDEIVGRFSKRYATMFNQKDFAEVLLELNEELKKGEA